MTTHTLPPETHALRPAVDRPAAPAPASGAFSVRNDPRLAQMRTGGALGTSMLALYPVFACVLLVLAGLSMAGPALPA
jgi:hypothetical protein